VPSTVAGPEQLPDEPPTAPTPEHHSLAMLEEIGFLDE
jgi:hypothetical protein